MYSISEKLKSQSFWYYINFGTNALFILVFQKILISSLGYSAFGEFSYFYSISSFLILFSELALSQRAAGFFFKKEYSAEQLLSLRSTFAFISSLILLVLYLIYNSLSYGFAVFVLSSILQATWYFQIKEEMILLGFLNLVSKIISASLVYLYPENAVLFFGLGYLLTFVVSGGFSPEILSFRLNFSLLRKIIASENLLFLGRLLAFFYTSFLSVIWFRLYNPEKAGQLSASYRLFQQFSILITPMVSLYILKHARGHFTSIKDSFKDSLFTGALLFYFILAVFAFFYSDILARIFLQSSVVFDNVAFVFSLIPVISLFSSVQMNVVLLGCGKNKEWFEIVSLSLVCSVFLQACVYFFKLQEIFIAASVVTVEFLVLVLGFIYGRK